MRLPWGFYADVLCLVLTGVGLTLSWLTGSLGGIVYHAAIGFVMTWHLETVVRKFSQNSHTSDECKIKSNGDQNDK